MPYALMTRQNVRYELRTSVPPVGPKNRETPCSETDNVPNESMRVAVDIGGWLVTLSSSSSGSVFSTDTRSSRKRGCGSLEPLACKMASASSSCRILSFILAIRLCRCSVAANTNLLSKSVKSGVYGCHRLLDAVPRTLPCSQAPYIQTLISA